MSTARDPWEKELWDKVEGEVMACIGCNDCMAACPLIESQQVTIAELNSTVLAGRVGLSHVADFVEACTQCQQCVPACPADLSRADMVLWNKLKIENARPDRRMKLQVGGAAAESDWMLDEVADFLAGIELFKPAPRKALRRMLLSVTLRKLEPGEVLCRAGRYHTRLYVVLRGRIEQAAHRAAADRTRLLGLGPGSVHGEVAVMNNQPEPFDVVALEPTIVVEMPRPAVFRLMREAPAFAQALEALYARRALWTYARSAPLLAKLPESVVEDLLRRAALRVLKTGERVYAQGDPPGSLYLVRSGFLRVARKRDDGREHVADYYGEGDVAGMPALIFDQPQAFTLSAATRVELVEIPGPAVREALARDPWARAKLYDEARQNEESLRRDPTYLGQPTGRSTTMLLQHEDLIREQVLQGRHILAIDTSICTDCNNCVDACARRHGHARLDRSGPQLGRLLFPSACLHCVDPMCLQCPINAIQREPGGEIRILNDKDDPVVCIGCGLCAERCPWDNIQMYDRVPGSAPGPTGSTTETGPFTRLMALVNAGLGTLSGRAPREPAAPAYKRVAVKCDLCFGHDDRACVRACPVGAALRIANPAGVIIGLELPATEAGDMAAGGAASS